MKLSIILYVISTLEYAFFAEKGSRRYHGNFGWSMNLAIGYLFLFSILYFLHYVYQSEKNAKNMLIILAGFLLLSEHLLWGIWYVVKLLLSQGIQCF